jgi:HD-like signal output (HDOD) protein
VIALSADPEVDFHEISSTIKSDPAFAADLLFLANSPLFGCGTTMVDLNRAIAQLGIPRVQVLAVTIAMRAFKSGSATANRMWQHSVAAAVVSEKLAKPMRLAPAEAYTSGLMHDIGRLGLLKTYPKQSEAVLACDDVAPAELLQLERAALKVQHTEAGGWLIQAWGLPGYVGDICRHHHDPPDAQDNPRLLVAKGACMIADALVSAPMRKSSRAPCRAFVPETIRMKTPSGRTRSHGCKCRAQGEWSLS